MSSESRKLADDPAWQAMSSRERREYLINRSLDNARTILDFDLNATKSLSLQNMMLQSKLKIITAVLTTAIRADDGNSKDRRIEQQRDQIFGEMAADFRKLREVK